MQVFHDFLFHADIADVVSRKHQDVGYIRRHRNDAEHLFFFVQTCCYVNIFVQQMWKWMTAVNNLRRQYRKDLLFKIFLHVLFLIRFQFFKIQPADSVWGQFFLDLCIGLIPFFV